MRKKVLLFNPLITAGGISKILADYIDNFSSDILVEIMTLEVKNKLYYEDDDIKIIEVGSSKNIIKRVKREYEIMKKGYDIVHINGDYISRIIECIVARTAKIKKIIIHSHNDNIPTKFIFKRWIHIWLKKSFDFFATDYIACSEQAAKWMFSKKIIKQKKYKVLSNGIDISKFKYNENIRNEIRKKYHIEKKFVLGFVGRFFYQKNPLFLIDILYECKKINNNSYLLLIGNGELEDEIRRKIKNLKLEQDILILKSRKDVNKFYNAFDCFLLPSHFEGLGIVNIEAQASGLPTIVSDMVPKEVEITNLIKFVSLKKSSNYWAKIILKSFNKNRESSYKVVIKSNYSIQSSIKELQKIYYTN